jgi:hypothetical protein
MQFTQCNSLSNNRTLRFEGSARLKALSNMTRLNLQFGNCGFRQSLLKGQLPRSIDEDGLKKFTFEQQTKRRLVELIGIEPMTPCLQSRCSPS